ncbi:MAG: hypothetical protein Q9184_006235 [Pyrenodesmia sp. 2 TL-2023]
MTHIVLYEEIPRPYAQPPRIPWDEFHKMTPHQQSVIETDMDDMFALLELVLEPLEVQMRYLQRRLNMHDLLQKLKWYAVLFRPITWISDSLRVTPIADRLWKFEERLDKLLAKQGIHVDTDPAESGRMPVIPITDLVIGRLFRLPSMDNSWTSTSNYAITHSAAGESKKESLPGVFPNPCTCGSYPYHRDVSFYLEVQPYVDQLRLSFHDFVDSEPDYRYRKAFPTEEREGYKHQFTAFCQALEVKPFGASNRIADSPKSRGIISGLREVTPTSSAADDVGFALDVSMKAKDACARCLTQHLGGPHLLHQRSLNVYESGRIYVMGA